MARSRDYSQLIAAQEAKLARTKAAARRARARRLIIVGAYFEAHLDAWEALTDSERKALSAAVGKEARKRIDSRAQGSVETGRGK
ncbi:MAG: hypothetical protein JSS25_00735 [Proteobacteria bacterium]|nr:hypothetical protein [Pseudomonadota bacterium]